MNNKKHDVNLLGRVGYGMCNFGMNIIATIVGAFVTMYYTDNVMLSAAFVGTMLLAVRVLDGISDLIMGAIIDHTHTRIGKARPWILIGSIFCALSMYFVFNAPSGMSESMAKVYCVVTYILNTVVFGTIVNVAWSTLAVKVSRNPDTRASMISIAQFFAQLAGLIAGSYTIPMILYFGGYETGYKGMTLVFGAIAFISILITGIVCKEFDVEETNDAPLKKEKKEKHSAKELLGYMFKNEYTIPLIIAFVLNWFALSLVATATVYFARDILGDANSMKVLNNARTLPAMIFLVIGVVPFFATKWGKKFTLLFACGSHIVSGAIMILAGGNVPLLVFGQVLRSVGSAFGSTMLMATVSDVADYVNMKNNVDISGMTSSVVSFGMKVGGGFGSAMMAWALAWGGYSAEVANSGLAQAASTLLAEKACFIYIPTVCFIILFFICTRLDADKKVKAMRAQMESK